MGLTLGSVKAVSRKFGATSTLKTPPVPAKNVLKNVKSENIGYICPDGTINFQSAKTAQEYAKNALKNVKTENIGYICPDGTINFQSEKAAQEYAKNVVVKAARQKNPYEKSVVVDKNRITYEYNGTQSNCKVALDKNGTWVHGHPALYAKGGAFPFSALDYSAFIQTPGLNRAIVYNSLGEKAEMIKLPPKWWEKFLPQQSILGAKIGVCSGEYNKALLLDKSGKKQLNKLYLKALWARITKNPEAAKMYTEQNLNLYNKLLQESISEKGAKAVHKFWEKYAHKLGVEYSTNFSNLV